MNYKKLSIIILALLILIFTIGIISASDDVSVNETSNSNSTSADDYNTPINNASENITKPKIKTKVQADEKAVKYKKSSYFKIKLQDKNNVLLNNVKLKVKVTSGKKVKTFNIKTNIRGIAQFNTKGLKIGKHNVQITSLDNNYSVSKKSKIFVGKQYSVMIRFSHVKVLKNKDKLKLRVRYDSDKGKEVTVVFKNKAKFTKILKAKFYFYNPKTKKVVSRMEYSKFKNGKWEWPDKDYSFRYLIYRARVSYISYKT